MTLTCDLFILELLHHSPMKVARSSKMWTLCGVWILSKRKVCEVCDTQRDKYHKNEASIDDIV